MIKIIISCNKNFAKLDKNDEISFHLICLLKLFLAVSSEIPGNGWSVNLEKTFCNIRPPVWYISYTMTTSDDQPFHKNTFTLPLKLIHVPQSRLVLWLSNSHVFSTKNAEKTAKKLVWTDSCYWNLCKVIIKKFNKPLVLGSFMFKFNIF